VGRAGDERQLARCDDAEADLARVGVDDALGDRSALLEAQLLGGLLRQSTDDVADRQQA
jgi:hypothetical protein